MNGGSIVANNAIYSMTGNEEDVNGVKVESGGTFEMNAGTIKEHTNYEVSSAGNFIMNGGIISGGKDYGVQIESGSSHVILQVHCMVFHRIRFRGITRRTEPIAIRRIRFGGIRRIRPIGQIDLRHFLRIGKGRDKECQ
jgi:hypothetical protein